MARNNGTQGQHHWDLGLKLSSGTVRNVINNPNETANNAPTLQINDGSWHHIAFMRNDEDIVSFTDGTDKATSAIGDGYVQDRDSYNIMIGGVTHYTHFIGYLDEFRITKGIARWTSNFEVY